ncbi:tRNA1(Val) (adenine(37)-N6)-methyltransferase [Rhodovibrionaceae bacterium A322]
MIDLKTTESAGFAGESSEVLDQESRDGLLGGRLRFRQPASGYRVAIDPILLAAALEEAKGTRVLELGCGSAAASLCLLTRLPAVTVSALELQPELHDLARQNARDNGLCERFHLHLGDLLDLPGAMGRDFDQVMLNPPFDAAGKGSYSDKGSKGLAHQEGTADLSDWIGQGLRCLKPEGWLTMVHRAARLDEILATLQPKCGAVDVMPLWPKPGRPAKRVLVRARKGAKAPTSLLPGLVLHQQDGSFTPEAEAILRQAKGLCWG